MHLSWFERFHFHLPSLFKDIFEDNGQTNISFVERSRHFYRAILQTNGTFSESLGKYEQTMPVSTFQPFQQAMPSMNFGLNHIDLENSSNTKEHVNT